MLYLDQQTTDESLFDHLGCIFQGISKCIDAAIKEKYINPTKELDCIEHLINLTTEPDRKKNLIIRKIEILANTPGDNAYDQILECFKQIKAENNHVIHFDEFPNFHKYTHNLITSNNFTEKAIEWCYFAAHSTIMLTKLSSSAQPTQEQKDLARYLLSAAQMNNLDAQMILLPYCTLIDCYSSGTHFYEILHCTHTALHNPATITKKREVALLIELLRQYTENGDLVPYFILCDYYKNDRQELENLMQFFSKSKDYIHALKDTNDTVSKIIPSCESIFKPYIDRYSKNKKNPSLTDAIATFTYAAMLAHSNDKNMLENATYLLSGCIPLYKRFNLPQFQAPIHTLLASTYYKRALPDEKNTKTDLTLLRKSVELGWLEAAHELANMYIQQCQNEESDILIKEEDFLPLLQKNLEHQKCERTIELMSMYCALKDKSTEIQQNSKKGKIQQLSELAHEKKMIKFEAYKEASAPYIQAMTLYDQANAMKKNTLKEQADQLLRQTIKEQPKHPCALMTFALRLLENNNYEHTKTYVQRALSYGLLETDKTDNDATKQFFCGHFLHTLFLCIESLIKNHPENIQNDILSIIHITLDNNCIDMLDFEELFEKIMNINLSKYPQWITEKVMNNKRNIIFKNLLNAKNFLDTFEETPIKKSQNCLNGILEYEKGNTEKGLELLQAAAKEKDHIACIILASKYFTGDGVPHEDFKLSEQYLSNALSYGIVEKKWCDSEFLDFVSLYVETVLTLQNRPDHMRKRLVTTINVQLRSMGVSLEQFREHIQDKTKIDLRKHGWIETAPKKIDPHTSETIKSTATPSGQRMIVLTQKAIEKKLIKHEHYKESLLAYAKLALSYAEAAEDICTQIETIPKKLEAADAQLEQIVKKNNTHPCAVMKLAERHLKQALTTKNYDSTKKWLQQALSNNLVKTKNKHTKKECTQFHNIYCLDLLFYYIEALIKEHPVDIQSDLITIIINTTFEKNDDLNLTDFCDLFQTITGINLAELLIKLKSKECAPETKANQANINDLIKDIVQDQEISLSPDFLAYDRAIKENNVEKSNNIAKKLIAEKNPIVIINTASGLLITDAQKNYNASKELLCEALTYGFVNQKFCNRLFLLSLFNYMKNIKKYVTDITKVAILYSTMKDAYKKNNINIGAVDRLFEQYIKNPFLLNSEQPIKQEPQSQPYFAKGFEGQANTNDLTKGMIKNPEDQTSSTLIDAVQAYNENNFAKVLETGNKLYKEGKNPSASAFLLIISAFIMEHDPQKNHDILEQYLCTVLDNGLTAQRFCSQIFVNTLCAYIANIQKYIPNDQTQQKLFSIIREALKKNTISIEIFGQLYEQQTKLPLPFSSEPYFAPLTLPVLPLDRAQDKLRFSEGGSLSKDKASKYH